MSKGALFCGIPSALSSRFETPHSAATAWGVLWSTGHLRLWSTGLISFCLINYLTFSLCIYCSQIPPNRCDFLTNNDMKQWNIRNFSLLFQKCKASVPVCEAGKELTLVEEGRGEPEKCCDVFECRKQGDFKTMFSWLTGSKGTEYLNISSECHPNPLISWSIIS